MRKLIRNWLEQRWCYKLNLVKKSYKMKKCVLQLNSRVLHPLNEMTNGSHWLAWVSFPTLIHLVYLFVFSFWQRNDFRKEFFLPFIRHVRPE